jgi:hypothetical protein
MYEMIKGPISPGLCACHICDAFYPIGDITYRLCVNPDHIFLGTKKDNAIDAAQKHRLHPFPKGVLHPESKLTQTQVDWLRSLPRQTRPTQKALAQQLGVAQGCVSFVLTGKTWRHSFIPALP